MEIGLENLFKELEINDEQAKVYLAALELGQASMQELAEKSELKRTSVYNYVEELITKKLIIIGKKRKRVVYSATHPNMLIEIEKARLAELNRNLPELLAIYNKSKAKPRVTFYEGIGGIKEVYADTLKEKQSIVGWSDFEHMAETLGDYYFDIYPPERARRGITIKTFIPDTPKSKQFTFNDAKYLRQTKIVSSSNWKTEINIYGNKVALMGFRSNPPVAVLIEDRDIADTIRGIWKQLWEKL